MPATTPPTVPMTRSRPRVSTSPRLEVPANTTNAAITAQYQRDGEISSPPTMARLVATPTWTACRVDEREPRPTASPSGSAALSPVAVSPVTVSPVTVSPVRSPVTAWPVTAWPVTAWPVTVSPVTVSPVTAWPVAASPLPAVPIAVVAIDASGAGSDGSSAGAVGWCLRPSTSASAKPRYGEGHALPVVAEPLDLGRPAGRPGAAPPPAARAREPVPCRSRWRRRATAGRPAAGSAARPAAYRTLRRGSGPCPPAARRPARRR